MAYGIGYAMKEAILGFKRAPWMSLLSMLTISLSLLVLGTFLLLAVNVQHGARGLRRRVEVEAFLNDEVDKEQVSALRKSIEHIEGVLDVTYISKAEAMDRFRSDFGGEFLEGIEGNPLPTSLVIRLKDHFRSTEQVEKIAENVASLTGVDDVEFGGQWLLRLNHLISVSWVIVATVGVIIGIACIVVTSNTINLTIMARREVVEVMRLVGATDRFIRRPYVYEGVLQGLIGGLLGVVLLMIVLQALLSLLPPGVFIPWRLWPGLVLLGMILGGVGSRISVSRLSRR